MNHELLVTTNETLDFNWEVYKNGYKGGYRLIPNTDVIGNTDKTKCFSREPYAQDLFNLLNGEDSKMIKKDLQVGEFVLIIDIVDIKNNNITLELINGLHINVDLNREKKLLQIFGYNSAKELTEILLEDKENIKNLLSYNLYAYILESSPNIKISLWEGYLYNIKKEFMSEIKNPTKAYTAKVISANKGGYVVSLQGVTAFLPGAMAAANKILDFQSYIGKEIPVMIEDYIVEMKSFIVSNKKYLQYILPFKLKELDLQKKYKGLITGQKNFGIFIEFDELFTGLLHVSKMKEETKKKFNNFEFNAGENIEFYIEQVDEKNRIILTEENPSEKLDKINSFIIENKNKIIDVEIITTLKFGLIVKTNDIVGLIPKNEFIKNKLNYNDYNVGETIKVIFDTYDNDKIYFKLKGE